jgi:8-oxo-dGTP diphosphatase
MTGARLIDVRDWLVGGALIESDDGLLLVRNRRRDGSHDWSTPGGVIEEGEDLLAGLAREVEEETGLVVTAWAGPVYEVRILAPEMGWRLRVEAHRAVAFSGELTLDDPDGIVVDARFVTAAEHEEHLRACSPWVREPLLEWLSERWELQRGFAYHVVGQDRASMKVTRR